HERIIGDDCDLDLATDWQHTAQLINEFLSLHGSDCHNTRRILGQWTGQQKYKNKKQCRLKNGTPYALTVRSRYGRLITRVAYSFQQYNGPLIFTAQTSERCRGTFPRKTTAATTIEYFQVSS